MSPVIFLRKKVFLAMLPVGFYTSACVYVAGQTENL